MSIEGYNFEGATYYHEGQFPPKNLDYEKLLPHVTRAATSLARYDALLRTMHNSEILLAPLRRREAVISSRIEGTVSTLEEVLKYEADEDEHEKHRAETIEVLSYNNAMNFAQRLMEQENLPLSGRLLKHAHSRLLFFGRGADKEPGNFKTEQNFVVDKAKRKVLFIPAGMNIFEKSFHTLEEYMNSSEIDPIVKTAVSHVEFEALHPFKDGNGRLGRMLITLMLWNNNLIAAPHFYVSGCLEKQKYEYIEALRNVSHESKWTEWCIFFCEIIVVQSDENIAIAENIRNLYEEMKEIFRTTTASQWSINALDFVFAKPVFRNSSFTANSGIPPQTAHRISKILADEGLLNVVQSASGRRSALYAFGPLLDISRA